MDKNAYNEKEKYYPILIKNQIKHENKKKNKDTDLKSTNKNTDKMIYFLSDKKERNSFTFFKTFIGNTDDISSDILNKKLIKVNTDNKSKSKNNLYNASCITNSVKRTNPKIKSKFNIKEEDLTMNQKINKFESRIDNLLNVINDFEAKFINSSETQKIKEQFNTIMNKNIYKNKIINNNLFKSFNKNNNKNKTEGNNNDILGIKNNATMDIKNINNINININNNNYENNYFITHSINDISHKVLNQKQNFPNKKFSTNSNNSIIKKSNLKSKKKMSKCNSNDLKNKTILNYKDKSKLFKLHFDSITNNNNSSKNTRYNNSYKDLQMPLTDRKEKDLEENKIIGFNDLRNSLKNFNKKKNNNCVKINKAGSSNKQIRSKNFIKKDGNNKVNLFKNKKQAIEKKNLTPSSAQGNPLINNTIVGGMDVGNKIKEKSVNGSAEFIRMKKKENSELINYILNKRNIIKGSMATSGNYQHDIMINRDFINNKKNLYNKKK